MTEVVIAGGGWAGCAAAVAAKKQGCQVTLIERTDLLLGLGNVGGIMRNNGRFTAAEENIAMGASELFALTDRYALHKNVDFPGHDHATFYDLTKMEPAVRELLLKMGVQVVLETRIVDVTKDCIFDPISSITGNSRSAAGRSNSRSEGIGKSEPATGSNARGEGIGKSERAAVSKPKNGRRVNVLSALVSADGRTFEGDVFIDCTGTTGPMGNCTEYGNGCSMCVLRCPTYGPRVSISAKAGGFDYYGIREDGTPGAFSGSCKLDKNSLAPGIVSELNDKGFCVVPLPKEQINEKKLKAKVCSQYALTDYAENLILIDTGSAKLMTSYFPLHQLRKIKGFECSRYNDPISGGRGNSIRYMAIAERDEYLKVKGTENLFCAGEKAGPYVGHTEAITTGSLAGYNAAVSCAEKAQRQQEHSWNKDTEKKPQLLKLPETIATGAFLAYPIPQKGMLTFAGDRFFEHMKATGLYTTDREKIRERIEGAGLTDIYSKDAVKRCV